MESAPTPPAALSNNRRSVAGMVEAADLEVNVLEFLHKSFSFERLATLDGEELAVFHRRETESESKLRPKILRLFVVIPRPNLVLDTDEGLLRITSDGVTPGPRGKGSAREAAADPTDFAEQGMEWHRTSVPLGIAYVPRARSADLSRPTALSVLGLG